MTLLLTGAGARSLERLPVDAYPDLSPPIVEIITQWPGHAAEEVERLITVPVELGMNGMPQTANDALDLALRSVRRHPHFPEMARTTTSLASRSSTGSAISSLPSGVTPSVSPLSSPSGLIYRYVLQSPDRSPMELKTLEDWIVEPQYKSVPGVADDSGFGGGTMQYQVLLDPAKIAAVGPVRGAGREPRSRPITRTPAAASIRRAASSTTCAAWAASRRSRTSATSCWPSTTARRCW